MWAEHSESTRDGVSTQCENCPSLPGTERFAGTQELSANTWDSSGQAKTVGHPIAALCVPTPRPEGTRGRSSSRSLEGVDTIGAVAETPPVHRNPEGRSPGSASPSRVRTGQANLDAREHRSPLMKATWPGPGHKEGQTRMECHASLGSPGGQTSPQKAPQGPGWDSGHPVFIQGEERHLLPLWDGNMGLEPPDSSSMKPPSMGFVLNVQGSEEEGPPLATTSQPAE